MVIGVVVIVLYGGKWNVVWVEEEVAVTGTATATSRGTANALDAYEMVIRSGGNLNMVKVIVNKGEKKSKVKIEVKEVLSGLLGVLFGVIFVVFGFGGFVAFKSLSGGSLVDDDDDDELICVLLKKLLLLKFEVLKVVLLKFDVFEIDVFKFEVFKFEMSKISGVGGSGLLSDAFRAGFLLCVDFFVEEEEE